MSLKDQNWMQKALRLAVRGIGKVSPNPPVGCVIVKEDRVIGRGWTQPGGRPHAEVMALSRQGRKQRVLRPTARLNHALTLEKRLRVVMH